MKINQLPGNIKKWLIWQGFNPDCSITKCQSSPQEWHGTPAWEYTPLIYAIINGKVEYTRILLEHGALDDEKSIIGVAIRAPIHKCELLKLLTQYGSPILETHIEYARKKLADRPDNDSISALNYLESEWSKTVSQFINSLPVSTQQWLSSNPNITKTNLVVKAIEEGSPTHLNELLKHNAYGLMNNVSEDDLLRKICTTNYPSRGVKKQLIQVLYQYFSFEDYRVNELAPYLEWDCLSNFCMKVGMLFWSKGTQESYENNKRNDTEALLVLKSHQH